MAAFEILMFVIMIAVSSFMIGFGLRMIFAKDATWRWTLTRKARAGINTDTLQRDADWERRTSFEGSLLVIFGFLIIGIMALFEFVI